MAMQAAEAVIYLYLTVSGVGVEGDRIEPFMAGKFQSYASCRAVGKVLSRRIREGFAESDVPGDTKITFTCGETPPSEA